MENQKPNAAPELGKTLADSLMKEIARVRDDVLPSYVIARYRGSDVEEEIKAIATESDKAIRALAEMDAVQCLECYGTLKGFSL